MSLDVDIPLSQVLQVAPLKRCTKEHRTCHCIVSIVSIRVYCCVNIWCVFKRRNID